jgi:D-alanyl-D-alanine carboxypeptidase
MKKVILSSFALLLAMLLVGCTTTKEQNPEQIQEPEKTGIDYLVLVNKQHKLPEDWEANLELVEVQNAYDETIKVEKEALEKYYELREDLLKD